ncbi:MAG TPA: LodA/GoxA family CTQ-dependent oxidase, partial [Longimicrobiaceae bacterium]|nr:LodA/GoxA family CTQ-dependent oxidase [Longimicrobiaceae bacterium]
MPTTYRIHPAIGIARLGNSPDEFCISPEEPAALPLDCDERGNPLPSPDGGTELRIRAFKDAHGRIKRQAARFQVYVYDDESPEGRPLSLGDPVAGGGNHGTLVDVQWRVYLANKKASWYEFRQLEGEHGYAPGHPRRNATVTDPEARQRLIIDPGPRIVDATTVRTARFDRDGWDVYAPTFPPPLVPHSIDTLGELRTDDSGRLLVLGGHGHSGSWRADEFGEPRIDDYANNDGWYDDTSDGPVMARLVMYSEQVGSTRFIDVEYPAWVLVGYPAYVPEMLDMITLDEVLEDLSIREFATRPDLYGEAGTWDHPRPVDRRDPGALAVWRAGRLQWNPAYRPWFYRDVWPILFRPDQFSYTSSILGQSNFPHNQSKRGNFDPVRLGAPPTLDAERLRKCEQGRVKDHHSGELFVSSFHPALMVLEREARAALGELAGEGVPGVPADLRVFGGRLAQRLREAVAAFTRAVYPGHPAEVEPYLAGWRTLGQPEAAGPPPVGSGPGTGSAPEHQGQGRRLAVAEARAEAVPL